MDTNYINDFKVVFPNYQDVFDKMCYILDINEPTDPKLQKLLNNENELFEFALKNGLLEIVIFLYEYRNISYDDKLLNYHMTDGPESRAVGQIHQVVLSNDNIKVSERDSGSYGAYFNPCISYLVRMRKFSKRRFEKGKGSVYQLNPLHLADMSQPYDQSKFN